MIRTAHLRIYLPATDRLVSDLPAAEVFEIRPRSHRFGILAETLTEDGIRTAWQGQEYRCPRTPTLRALEGLVAMSRLFRAGAVALIPESVAREAAAELLGLREGGWRSHILSSAWHVPIRWFAPFSPEDREVLGVGDQVGIRYRTSQGLAVERLSRAVHLLEDSPVPRPIAEEVESLHDWLVEFPGEAMLELDYASVAGLFDPMELIADESAADLWGSLAALDSRDWGAAGDHYGVLMARWVPSIAIVHSN